MDQIRVVFLGTSAGLPSRQRNVAAVAVILDGRVLLFDCGEGTQQQLLRSSVRTGAIEAIFITHLHGDHLYGLPGLLASASLSGREAPLAVYGPPGLRDYLANVIRTTHVGFTYEMEMFEIDRDEVRRGDGYRIVAAPLDHTTLCFGFAVIEDDRSGAFNIDRARELAIPPGPLYGRLQRGEDVVFGDRVIRSSEVVGPPRRGRRIVYCTDTRPCRRAVDLARGADVLIHEATYTSDLAREASERGHATAEDAAGIAADAGVGRLILTHISPRYLDVEPLVTEARRVFARTDAAEDFMEIPIHHREHREHGEKPL